MITLTLSLNVCFLKTGFKTCKACPSLLKISLGLSGFSPFSNALLTFDSKNARILSVLVKKYSSPAFLKQNL